MRPGSMYKRPTYQTMQLVEDIQRDGVVAWVVRNWDGAVCELGCVVHWYSRNPDCWN